MADAAKRVRAAAMGRFTRSVNRVNEAIQQNETIEEIKLLFQDVSESRNTAIEKQEAYLQQNDAVEDDNWFDELENVYVELRRKVNKVIKGDNEAKVLEQLLVTFNHSEKNFTSAIKRTEAAISNECSKALIEIEKLNLVKTFEELSLRSCKELTQIDESKSLEFINNEESFMQWNMKIDEYMQQLEMTVQTKKIKHEISNGQTTIAKI